MSKPRLRARKPKSELLNDSINVPVTSALKQKVADIAKRSPGKPSTTKYVRLLIEQTVETVTTAVG